MQRKGATEHSEGKLLGMAKYGTCEEMGEESGKETGSHYKENTMSGLRLNFR